VLQIKSQVKSGVTVRSRVLLWRDHLWGVAIPDAQILAKTIAQKYKPVWADLAMRGH
jgi:hypothetical protein